MFNLESFIRTFSYIGIFGIIFAESGLLVGIIFPGDSLLFVAGFLASQGRLNLVVLIAVVFAAAVLGDNTGYYIGKRYGRSIFRRPNSRFFNQDMVSRTEQFYDKHGGKTIVLSRFLPVIRTITPILTGISRMPWRRYFGFNLLGALLWAVGVTLLGYFLGQAIPNIDHYLLPAVVVIIIVSVLPSAWHLWRQRSRQT